MAVALTATLAAAPVMAAQQPSSPTAGNASPRQDAAAPASSDDRPLGVSLDKIRDALRRPPFEPLKGLDERPLFHVQIQETTRLEELLKSIKFDSGPVIPGGPYAYEQQRLMFPSVDNPLAQPWSAFNQSELAQLSVYSLIETLLARYVAKHLVNAVTTTDKLRGEQDAREELRRAVGEYCAAQPYGGSGIQLCESPPTMR